MPTRRKPSHASGTRAPFDPDAALRTLAKRFREIGSPERAEHEKAYMKSALRFHGVTSPQVVDAVRELLAAHTPPTRDQIHALVDAAYASGWFDLRSAALSVMGRRVNALEPDDLPWLVDLVRRSGCWAHVDWIAPKMLGDVLGRHPELLGPRLREWAKDPDFWVRRAALLSQLDSLRRGAGDFALFAEIAGPMVVERELFIRKAIGWILREVSKKRPELAFAFLRDHRAKVAGLTLREGAKYLPADMRLGLGLS
ncbi:MAG: DNA alkylation repair protein [Deltaproteobacteria bacterium]|nr:DNA alkylation repair protein [Deltaproteobacteria bacterium]